MAHLTLEQIARENDNPDANSTISLHLSHRALSNVSCLASLKKLEKLDLSFNCLSSLESLSACINLKWLSVVENKLETLKGIERLCNLMVFNAGKNKLRRIDEISHVTSLRAIILNENNISSICKLDQLEDLNTLVLSKNPIYEISDSLMKAKALTKLSLSHCQLQQIGSSLTSCVKLKELRLAHNKITNISTELAQNARLENLDMGNNLIESWSELKVLSALPNLKNLNFQGNPIAEKDKLAKKVKQLVPNLRILNAKPVENNKKRKKFSEEDSLSNDDVPHPHNIEEADREMKRKKSKKDVKNSEKTIFKKSGDEGGNQTKRKVEKEDVTAASSLRTSNKTKIKEFENEGSPPFDIDNIESLSVLPTFNNRTSQKIETEKKGDKVVRDEKQGHGLIVEHKKNKKEKSIDRSALQLLAPASEVGLGGPSTWDD